MKLIIVVMLILGPNGYYEKEFKVKGNCNDNATKIREAIAKYYDHIDGDAKRQGFYTPKGHLVFGHYCKAVQRNTFF